MANPNIQVKLTDYPCNQCHDNMVLRLKGRTRTDVMYNGEDRLAEFAAAGWVAPPEDFFPEVRKYKERTAPYALADMTYKGKLCGLSYYADIFIFQYNKGEAFKHLQWLQDAKVKHDILALESHETKVHHPGRHPLLTSGYWPAATAASQHGYLPYCRPSARLFAVLILVDIPPPIAQE